MNARTAHNHFDRELPVEVDPEQRAQAVTARAIDSMLPGGEFDPLDSGNLAEAISEVGGALGSTFWAVTAKLVDSGRAHELLAHIRTASYIHWYPRAEADAERELANETRD